MAIIIRRQDYTQATGAEIQVLLISKFIEIRLKCHILLYSLILHEEVNIN